MTPDREDRLPRTVLEVGFWGGGFTATCRSCFLECEASATTMANALSGLPCTQSLREFACLGPERAEGGGR